MAEKVEDKKITTKHVSAINVNTQRGYYNRKIITDLLTELSNQTDLLHAMDVVVDKTPDGRMALNTYITFTNRDGHFVFKNPKTGRRTKKPELAFEKFIKKIDLFKKGDQWVRSAYTHTGMAYEILVSADMKHIEDVLVVDPITFSSFEYNTNTKKWQIFQNNANKTKIDLYSGNFDYFPYQPKPSSPVGSVAFGSSLSILIPYYQFISDTTEIMRKIAIPRYDVTVDTAALLEQVSHSEKADLNDRAELIKSELYEVGSQLSNLSLDSDFVHTSTTNLDIIGAGINGSGIDIRAWEALYSPLICNAFNLKPIMMGREQNGSYALGTAEYEAFISGIDPVAEDLSKIYEAVGDMFCRIYGYNAVCEYIPAPLEWQDEKVKWEIKNLQADYYGKTEEMGWHNGDIASQELFGIDKKPNRTNEDRFRFMTSGRTETVKTETEEGKIDE